MSTPFNYLDLTFNNGNAAVTNITQPIYSNVLGPAIYGTSGLTAFTLYGTVDVNTPGATTYASASKVTDSGDGILFTKTTATGYFFGLIVQFSTSTTLPTGISASTDYFVVPVTSTTFKVCTSYANALAATYIAYTNTGTGTQTATPTAIATASCYLQGSFDETNWVTVPFSTTTITADGSFSLNFPNVWYQSYRLYVTLASGSMAFSPLRIGWRGV